MNIKYVILCISSFVTINTAEKEKIPVQTPRPTGKPVTIVKPKTIRARTESCLSVPTRAFDPELAAFNYQASRSKRMTEQQKIELSKSIQEAEKTKREHEDQLERSIKARIATAKTALMEHPQKYAMVTIKPAPLASRKSLCLSSHHQGIIAPSVQIQELADTLQG